MKEFLGKTAVVTGGASGIGLAMAIEFAQEGMQVVLADIDEEALSRSTKQLKEREYTVAGIKVDMRDHNSTDRLLEKTVDQYGDVHIFCNNAGIFSNSKNKAVWDIDQADWDSVFETNLQGVLNGIQVFVPHMLRHNKTGHVVTTASLSSLIPTIGPAAYTASKRAVLGLAEKLDVDLVAQNSHIGSSVLCPGYVHTNLLNSEEYKSTQEETDALIKHKIIERRHNCNSSKEVGLEIVASMAGRFSSRHQQALYQIVADGFMEEGELDDPNCTWETRLQAYFPPTNEKGFAIETDHRIQSYEEKDPKFIARMVLESIRENTFYILPHRTWDDKLKSYFDKVLSRDKTSPADDLIDFFEA